MFYVEQLAILTLKLAFLVSYAKKVPSLALQSTSLRVVQCSTLGNDGARPFHVHDGHVHILYH